MKNGGDIVVKKYDDEEIKRSLEEHTGKRKYGEDGKQKRSQKKQRISNQHGWNARMRTKFYEMSANMNRMILKEDMTDLAKRPDGIDGKRDVQKGKKAEGFWSDNHLDRAKATYENFLKFIIERDEERRKNGFYEDNPKVKEIKELKDINHHDVRDFVEFKFDNDCEASTVRTYVGHIQKVSEVTAKHGIKGHEQLTTPKFVKSLEIPKKEKSEFVRNKGKTDGIRGYTAAQGEKLIAHVENPYAKAGAIILNDIGLRKDTFFKLQWRDVLDENEKVKNEFIELFRPGLMKGGREQIARISERAAEALQGIWDNGNFNRDQEVFGGFTPYTFEKEMRKACTEAELDWKSYHAFRRSTVEQFDEVAQTMTKEQLVDEILKYVDVEVPHRKTGELYKPHNPIVEKTRPQTYHAKDKDGNLLYKKDGSPLMKVVRRQDKEGRWYTPMEKVTDETGHVVMGSRWTKEELLNSRIDFLRNIFTAEQISHNRPDANSPYRFTE